MGECKRLSFKKENLHISIIPATQEPEREDCQDEGQAGQVRPVSKWNDDMKC